MEYDNNNILPNNIERVLFHRSDSIVPSLRAQADTVCRNRISEEYIKKVFKQFDYGYAYKAPNDEYLGFCIWKISKITKTSKEKGGDNNSYTMLHILLVCTKQSEFQVGKMIFFDLDTYCLNNKIEYIELEPLKDLVEYYKGFGFKLIQEIRGIKMQKDVYIASIRRNFRNKTRKVTRNGKRLLTQMGEVEIPYYPEIRIIDES